MNLMKLSAARLRADDDLDQSNDAILGGSPMLDTRFIKRWFLRRILMSPVRAQGPAI
ncbi:hypothetical protein PS639_05955 [Pseudomonas fluorescens]|nr:hypothetical protein PS639_04303 [Pseudomonas fluorescens]VVN47955.1 hypothetical protein PS639_05955 [Pseudomonas fluorescens]